MNERCPPCQLHGTCPLLSCLVLYSNIDIDVSMSSKNVIYSANNIYYTALLTQASAQGGQACLNSITAIEGLYFCFSSLLLFFSCSLWYSPHPIFTPRLGYSTTRVWLHNGYILLKWLFNNTQPENISPFSVLQM